MHVLRWGVVALVMAVLARLGGKERAHGGSWISAVVLFGYAINTDVRHIPTVVFDSDRTAFSRDFARRMVATGFYDFVGEARNHDEIQRALRRGYARVGLVVPAGFGVSAAVDGQLISLPERPREAH